MAAETILTADPVAAVEGSVTLLDQEPSLKLYRIDSYLFNDAVTIALVIGLPFETDCATKYLFITMFNELTLNAALFTRAVTVVFPAPLNVLLPERTVVRSAL